jgi:hypothetical protein
MSNQIDEISSEPASAAGEDKRRKKPVDRPMSVSLVNVPPVVLPSGLAHFFNEPPLVGNEKREEFDRFFLAIAAGVNPAGDIAWLFTWDIVCLSWEIRRERIVKAHIIRSAQIEFVRGLLGSGKLMKSTPDGRMRILARLQEIEGEARHWVKNPTSLPETTKKLADNGYGQSEILAEAFILGARNIDAIDRRLASYEIRRMAVLREVENYSEKFSRKLATASDRVIDAEFTDAPKEGS